MVSFFYGFEGSTHLSWGTLQLLQSYPWRLDYSLTNSLFSQSLTFSL